MAIPSKEYRYASTGDEDYGSVSPAAHVSADDGVVGGHTEKRDVFGSEEQHQVGEQNTTCGISIAMLYVISKASNLNL